MKIKIKIIFLLSFNFLSGQTYLHPTSGLAQTYVGNCMVNTCSGTYVDNGGTGSNYSNNINLTYRVFCPTSPNQCIRLNFTSFNVECANPPCTVCFDYLRITDSPTQNGPILFQGCSSGALPAGNPFTASNSSGCLSVRFYSNNSVTRPGWVANISCVPCTQAPSGQNNDCSNATAICSNASFSGNSSGPGFTSESCTGCTVGGENYSNWYFFQVTTGGSLTFTITPVSSTGDYDFALYGPNVTCATLGSSISCNYAANTGGTGLQVGATQTSQGVLGTPWNAPLTVSAGQTYYLMINQWEATANGFTLSFGGSASLNCAVLPVEIKNFQCESYRNGILVYFETLNEFNTEYFIVERAGDNLKFEEIQKISAKKMPSGYVLFDENPKYGNNYYRLVQMGPDRSRNEIDGRVTSCGYYYMKNYFFRIFDMSGKLIKEGNYEGDNIREHLSELKMEKGIYMVHLYDGNGKREAGQIFKWVKAEE